MQDEESDDLGVVGGCDVDECEVVGDARESASERLEVELVLSPSGDEEVAEVDDDISGSDDALSVENVVSEENDEVSLKLLNEELSSRRLGFDRILRRFRLDEMLPEEEVSEI